MAHYLLCPNTDISPNIRASDNSSCNEMIWEDGEILNPEVHDFTNLEFICENLPSWKLTDYMMSDMGCSVISERCKNIFDQLWLNNIQYFPATVIEKEGEKAKNGYYAINFIELTNCIDIESSDLDSKTNRKWELFIWSIDSLTLLKDIDCQNAIFRAWQFTRIIIADQKCKDLLEKNNLTSIRCITPERWDGYNGEI